MHCDVGNHKYLSKGESYVLTQLIGRIQRIAEESVLNWKRGVVIAIAGHSGAGRAANVAVRIDRGKKRILRYRQVELGVKVGRKPDLLNFGDLAQGRAECGLTQKPGRVCRHDRSREGLVQTEDRTGNHWRPAQIPESPFAANLVVTAFAAGIGISSGNRRR